MNIVTSHCQVHEMHNQVHHHMFIRKRSKGYTLSDNIIEHQLICHLKIQKFITEKYIIILLTRFENECLACEKALLHVEQLELDVSCH